MGNWALGVIVALLLFGASGCSSPADAPSDVPSEAASLNSEAAFRAKVTFGSNFPPQTDDELAYDGLSRYASLLASLCNFTRTDSAIRAITGRSFFRDREATSPECVKALMYQHECLIRNMDAICQGQEYLEVCPEAHPMLVEHCGHGNLDTLVRVEIEMTDEFLAVSKQAREKWVSCDEDYGMSRGLQMASYVWPADRNPICRWPAARYLDCIENLDGCNSLECDIYFDFMRSVCAPAGEPRPGLFWL